MSSAIAQSTNAKKPAMIWRVRAGVVAHLKAILSVKDVLPELVIHFFPNDSPDAGIIASSLHESQTALSQLIFPKSEIDLAGMYDCSERCINVINVQNLVGAITAAGDPHELVFTMRDESSMLRMRSFDANGNLRSDTHVSVMEAEGADREVLRVPRSKLNYAHTLANKEFQSMIQHIQCVGSEWISVRIKNGTLSLHASGDGLPKMTLNGTPDHGRINKNEIDVCNRYNFKLLQYFSRPVSLGTQVTLHMTPDGPIVVHYKVAGLGEIYFSLAALEDPGDASMHEDPVKENDGITMSAIGVKRKEENEPQAEAKRTKK